MLRVCKFSEVNAFKRNFLDFKVISVSINHKRHDSSVPVFFLFKDFLHPDFFNVIAISKYFESFNTVLGLPWYAGIIGGTIILKSTISLPLQILSERNLANCKYVSKNLPEMYQKVESDAEKFATEKNLPAEVIPQFKKLMLKQYKKQIYPMHNCHPLKSLVFSLYQVPIWITTSFTFRSMLVKDELLENLQKEGALWFTDLTQPDPYMILSLLFLMANVMNVEVHFSKIADPKIPSQFFRIFGHISSLCFCGLSTTMPSMLVLYWSTSAICHLANNIIMLAPSMRRYFKIRKLETDFDKPFDRIWNNFRFGKN